MIDNMITISGKKYYLDIDAIAKWCLTSAANPIQETEINEGYDTDDEGDMTMITRVVRELKTNNVQDDTIRYDFIKMLLGPFLGDLQYDDITSNFSYTLLYNSLIKMGFLVEITD